MSTVAALGDADVLEGFALAGVDIRAATTDDEVVAAWDALDDEVGLVILTARAALVLGARLDQRPDRLTVVIP